MICWWCGKKLTNPFGKPVDGKSVTLPGGHYIVRVHKVCSADAERYVLDAKLTANPHDQSDSAKQE